MKNLKSFFAAYGLVAFLFMSCSGDKKRADESRDTSGTLSNPSSEMESRKATGQDAGNQKEKYGYPENQSNLNDSTGSDTLK
jgi:hypothetical protein